MGSVVEACGALALVVLLIVGSGRLVRRRVGTLATQSARLRVVARSSLGARASLLVVEVERHRFLLALSPRGVRLLADLGAVVGEEGATVERLDLRQASDPEAAVLEAFGSDARLGVRALFARTFGRGASEEIA